MGDLISFPNEPAKLPIGSFKLDFYDDGFFDSTLSVEHGHPEYNEEGITNAAWSWLSSELYKVAVLIERDEIPALVDAVPELTLVLNWYNDGAQGVQRLLVLDETGEKTDWSDIPTQLRLDILSRMQYQLHRIENDVWVEIEDAEEEAQDAEDALQAVCKKAALALAATGTPCVSCGLKPRNGKPRHRAGCIVKELS